MVRTTDSPGRRLAHLLHRGPKVKSLPTFDQIVSEYCSGPKDGNVDFLSSIIGTNRVAMSQDELWDVLARSALKLGDDNSKIDREMRRTFEHFKLDHRNPHSWRLLVAWLSQLNFAEKRGRGTPKRTWTVDNLLKLKREIKMRDMENRRLWPAAKVAPLLAKDKSSSFHGYGKEILRQMVLSLRKTERELHRERAGDAEPDR